MGILVNRMVEESFREAIFEQSHDLPVLNLDAREIADLALIATGAYTPLQGFMTRGEYESVVSDMRLPSGSPWPLPVTLSVGKDEVTKLREGCDVRLADGSGQLLGILHLEEIFPYDQVREAQLVYGTVDSAHPGVRVLYKQKKLLAGGRITLLQRPEHENFSEYRLDPKETRHIFRQRKWASIVGFQTRNPVHRAHEYLHKCAIEMYDGLFLHPIVGPTKEDDIPAGVRVRCYEAILREYYPPDKVLFAVLPTAMRYAGPREAVFHAIVRRNYGCTHFIVGRDHAGVGNYYLPYAAHQIFSQFREGELGIQPIFFDDSFYCRKCKGVASTKTCPHSEDNHLVFSGTMIRELLQRGESLPQEFTRPEVAQVLMDWVRRVSPESNLEKVRKK